MLRKQAVTFRAVKIIRIDGGERFTHRVGGHENRMGGAPRLGAAGRHGKPRRQFVQFLKDVFHRDAFLETRADDFPELRFDVVPDDEDELAEAGAHRVINRIINDRLAVGADRINLLQPAVTAAHAGGHHK